MRDEKGRFAKGSKFCGKIVHGLYKTRINGIWRNMRYRCNSISSKDYNNYGGRGITICKEWDDFMEFYKWSMANGYNDNLSIDRINNDKGYSSDNCRWATSKEQAGNRRKVNYSQLTMASQKSFIATRLSDNYSEISLNQRTFCFKYSLDAGNVNAVLMNKRKSHKGWSFSFI